MRALLWLLFCAGVLYAAEPVPYWGSRAAERAALLTRGQSPIEPKDDSSKPEKEKEKTEKPEPPEAGLPDWLSVHGQATTVPQGNFPFRSPYQGTNSLRPNATIDTTTTATLFIATRLPWKGGEIVFNPEVAGGTGVSGSTGLAGFPNGEATRTGALEPTPYVARLFYRHVTDLNGETEDVEDGVNQPARTRSKNRLTWQIGKMAAVDVIGDNPYSHDARTQFLNWSLMYNGAWDFPANVRGYTYGTTLEWTYNDWAFTYGVFGVPRVANGAAIDPRFTQANGQVIEIERSFKINGHDAKIRIVPFINSAHMGSYAEAIANQPVNPDITSTRKYRLKYGLFVNYEQEILDDIGVIARGGWNDGQSETWAYTEIDHTVVLGTLVKGSRWQRPNDRVGFAWALNGLSSEHRRYLAAGGLGFIVGDGRLNYNPENVFELFYNCRVRQGLFVTLDLQGIINPGYNQDRGPVGLLGVRLHYEF